MIWPAQVIICALDLVTDNHPTCRHTISLPVTSPTTERCFLENLQALVTWEEELMIQLEFPSRHLAPSRDKMLSFAISIGCFLARATEEFTNTLHTLVMKPACDGMTTPKLGTVIVPISLLPVLISSVTCLYDSINYCRAWSREPYHLRASNAFPTTTF